jgi:hypothetical protein
MLLTISQENKAAERNITPDGFASWVRMGTISGADDAYCFRLDATKLAH